MVAAHLSRLESLDGQHGRAHAPPPREVHHAICAFANLADDLVPARTESDVKGE